MGRNHRFKIVDLPDGSYALKAVGPPGVTHVDEETARIWLGRMEWHANCRGRHGVLRNVPDELIDAAKEGIGYYLGHGGDHAKPNGDGTWDIEFVHQTKVYPPPVQPWEWCGESVLFHRPKSQ